MAWHDLFQGDLGRIYASSGVLLILTLTFIVSFRLYFDRHKKGYLFILISLLLIIIQHGMLITIELTQKLAISQMHSFTQTVKLFSFILINMGLYRLYNRYYQRDSWIFYASLLISVLVSYLYIVEHLHFLWLDLYEFTLIFLCFILISPRIGQVIKFQIGLAVYFIAQLAHLINSAVYQGKSQTLETIELFVPIVFYSIIFLFIFGRIVELLQAVYQSSIRDGLTSLYNRRFIENAVKNHISRHQHGFILFFDIDNFKSLNDTQGHQRGDEVLQGVARIIMEEMEEYGLVGRYGGEEIVAVVMDPEVNAKTFAERIRSRIETETAVTVSVGDCHYEKGISHSAWIKNADHAMYYSKKTGKNKVTRYHEMNTAPKK